MTSVKKVKQKKRELYDIVRLHDASSRRHDTGKRLKRFSFSPPKREGRDEGFKSHPFHQYKSPNFPGVFGSKGGKTIRLSVTLSALREFSKTLAQSGRTLSQPFGRFSIRNRFLIERYECKTGSQCSNVETSSIQKTVPRGSRRACRRETKRTREGRKQGRRREEQRGKAPENGESNFTNYSRVSGRGWLDLCR